MPTSYSQYLRFQIIDRELRRWPSITTKRLTDIISRELEKTVQLRTVQKDIVKMKSDVKLGYLAPIEYLKGKSAIKYSDPEYSITKFNLKENELRALKFYAGCLGLYSKYSIFSDFTSAIEKVIKGIDIRSKLSPDSNPGVFIQTDTIADIVGIDYLALFVDAIVEKQFISFVYKKFLEDIPSERAIVPYLLKEYKNRWYVLGLTQRNNNIATFALDRMTNVRLLQERAEELKCFNSEEYFQHAFGITRANEPVETIVLKFSKTEAPYIKSLKIHPTQKTVKNNRSGLTISIKIIPSYEFYEYILGKTPDVKVVSPRSIANTVKMLLERGLSLYKK